MKKILILLAAALITGCITSPKVNNTSMALHCEEDYDYVDSLGVAHYPCHVAVRDTAK